MLFVEFNYFSLFLVMAGIQDDQQPIQIKDWSKLRVFSFYCKSRGSQNEFFPFTANILLFQVYLP